MGSLGVGVLEDGHVAGVETGHLGVELSEGHVGELVHGHGVGLLAGGVSSVVLADLVEVRLENGI